MDDPMFLLRVLFVALLCLPLAALGWVFVRSLIRDLRQGDRSAR